MLRKIWYLNLFLITFLYLTSTEALFERLIRRFQGKPIPCPKVFNPVCASLFGVKSTFLNECLVNAENVKYNKDWKIFSTGICAEDYSYYSPRLHKSRQSFSQNPEQGFDENALLGDNVVNIVAPSIFQTQLLRTNIGNAFKLPHDFPPKEIAFNQPNINYKTFIENNDNNANFQKQRHTPVISYGNNDTSYNGFDSAIQNIIKSIQKGSQVPENTNAIDIKPLEQNSQDHTNSKPIDNKLLKTNVQDRAISKAFNLKPMQVNSQDLTISKAQDLKRLQINSEDHTIAKAIEINPQLRNSQPYETSNTVDTSNCQMGNTPLCCTFQGGKTTFKNICELNLHNEDTDQDWQILYEGPCNDCENNCPKNFDPVCASRKGLNYTIRNECLLNLEICRDKAGGWKKLKNGICETKEKSEVIKYKYEFKPPGFYFIKRLKKLLNEPVEPSDISNSSLSLHTSSNVPESTSPNQDQKDDVYSALNSISSDVLDIKTTETPTTEMPSSVDQEAKFIELPLIMPPYPRHFHFGNRMPLETLMKYAPPPSHINNLSRDDRFIADALNNENFRYQNNMWTPNQRMSEVMPDRMPYSNHFMGIQT